MFWNLGNCVASQLYRHTLPLGRPWHAFPPALHASLPAHLARIPSPAPAACRHIPAQCQMQNIYSCMPAIVSITVCLADEPCNHQVVHACPPALRASLTALLARTPPPTSAACKNFSTFSPVRQLLVHPFQYRDSWLLIQAITTLTTLALQLCTLLLLLCQHKHSVSATCSMQMSSAPYHLQANPYACHLPLQYWDIWLMIHAIAAIEMPYDASLPAHLARLPSLAPAAYTQVLNNYNHLSKSPSLGKSSPSIAHQ